MSAAIEPYTTDHKVRFVTATSLFDGHDATINVIRRILQSSGAEVIHLGHNRSVEEIVTAAIQEDAREAGASLAAQAAGNTLQDLLRVVRQVWAEDDALEFTILEQTDQKLSFNVTRCKYAELYQQQGVREFGFCLSCNRDSAFIQGFNPRLQLQRTQTIMQGAESCDFRITLE